MPQLIRTPEQIFREEGRDIYLIRIKDEEGRDLPAWQEIQDWISANLPNTHVEMLGPSEDSGFICGYFGDLRVDFSEADLAAFCARWETPDGKSVDPRFQCYLWPYEKWSEKHGNFIPTKDRPAGLGLTLWWDTPIGFIHHQITLEDAAVHELENHPGRPEDLWMHALRLWPELASVDTEKLVYGRIVPDESREGAWLVLLENSPFNGFSNYRRKKLRDWFNLPKSTRIENYW